MDLEEKEINDNLNWELRRKRLYSISVINIYQYQATMKDKNHKANVLNFFIIDPFLI